jgi:hypothetical protein
LSVNDIKYQIGVSLTARTHAELRQHHGDLGLVERSQGYPSFSGQVPRFSTQADLTELAVLRKIEPLQMKYFHLDYLDSAMQVKHWSVPAGASLEWGSADRKWVSILKRENSKYVF